MIASSWIESSPAVSTITGRRSNSFVSNEFESGHIIPATSKEQCLLLSQISHVEKLIMWMMSVFLPLVTAAQLSPIPCSVLGEPFANLSMTVTPEVPSLQSWATFTLSGVSLNYSNSIRMEVSFDSTIISSDIPPLLVQQGDSFDYSSGFLLPRASFLMSGQYQYSIDLFGPAGLCMQGLRGEVLIGTTAPFTVLNFNWSSVVSPDTPVILQIEAINNLQESLNLKECQVEVLIYDSELLDKVACEVTGVPPGALFHIATDSMKVPNLAAGNYTVRVHFYDEWDL